MSRRQYQEPNYFANQEPSGDFLHRPMSRRGFFRRAGEAVLVAATADTLAGEILWGNTKPEIHVLDNSEARQQFPTTYTLAIGGFNVANVKGLARSVEAILPGYGQVAYLQNSDYGLDLDDIERETINFIEKNKVERLRLYGHSMGGMLAVQLGAALTNKIEHLEALILDCSPASYKDVRGGDQEGARLLHTTDELWLHFGPGARFALETISPLLNGRDDFFRVCRDALGKVSSGEICSNRLVQSQASLIRTFNVRAYRHAFGDETHIIRLRPEHYENDSTINNESSLPRWQNGLAHSILDVAVEGSGHANPGQHEDQYTNALRRAAQQCDFYHGEPAYNPHNPV
jgi:pimeloyl-ACP methyl ester carboxylesterase